jgi:hypothetical protein
LTPTTPSPALHLALLEAKAQETFPEHTCKAVLLRVHREKQTVQERAEMLEGLISEFERGGT